MNVRLAMWILTVIASLAVGAGVVLLANYRRDRREDLGFELGLSTGQRLASRALTAVTAARIAVAKPAEAAVIADIALGFRRELSKTGGKS
jgi:hypothetical protein